MCIYIHTYIPITHTHTHYLVLCIVWFLIWTAGTATTQIAAASRSPRKVQNRIYMQCIYIYEPEPTGLTHDINEYLVTPRILSDYSGITVASPRPAGTGATCFVFLRNWLAWPHCRRGLASDGVRYVDARSSCRPPVSKRYVTKLTTNVRIGRGYLWGSFLIAAAALKTPTRNGYNAQGVNLKF